MTDILKVSVLSKEDKWSAFGHYLVGNDPNPVYHPRIAMEMKRAGKGDIKFIFHDNVFAAANPKVEPAESLLELYHQRIQQLKSKYDYIVLMYSGGADSHNILKCFEHFDVRLDEIVSFVDSSYKDRDSKISSEVYKVAVPEVEQYQQKYPETIYRLLEVREIQNKLFRDTEFKFDMYQDMVYHLIPFSIMHFYGLLYIDKYRDLHAAGKKVCVLHGIDKPRLKCINNKWSFHFSDWSSYFGQKHYYRDLPFYDEFFYWSPELPQLAIKQAHVATKYLDYLDSQKIEHTYRNNQLANVVKRKGGSKLNWEFFNHIIYPFWTQGTYSTGKTFESYISNGRDNTLTSSNDEIMTAYKKSVMKSLVLAIQSGRNLIATGLDDKATTNNTIGINPMFAINHFIE